MFQIPARAADGSKNMDVKIFTTGGTIDKVYFDAKSTYEVGDPQIVDILREANVTIDWELETLFRKDSLDLTDEDRAVIVEKVRRESCPRILITHGTDTMIETAKALQGIPGKTIVLVGSLSPARFKSSDAEFNIGFALAAVQTLPPGVYIAMNGRIFHPDRVRKNREANRFEPI
ncbi:Asparaginase/glutaminase [Rhodothermus marinus SG0.5JP17-172]|nr:Asparaginase/glutaminase [Rhodothermus marinus SG0.5JP17-172]